MQSLPMPTLLMVQKSQLFGKKLGMMLYLSSAPLKWWKVRQIQEVRSFNLRVQCNGFAQKKKKFSQPTSEKVVEDN